MHTSWLVLLCPMVAVAMPPPRQCEVDADCFLATPCCASRCCEAPVPMGRAEAEALAQTCAKVRCRGLRCSDRRCPVSRPVEARCQDNRCIAAPAVDVDQCTTDGDCVAIAASCCPTCCATPQKVVSRRRAALEHQVCAATACPTLSCGVCTMMMPEPVNPVCRAQRCVAEATPQPECTTDADCALGDVTPCSPHSCSDKKPPFGLSTGSSTPSCVPCPTVPVCRAGRCLRPR